MKNYYHKWPNTERSIITDDNTLSAVALDVYRNEDVDDIIKAGDGFIWGLFVEEPHRGQGIGRALLQRAETIAKDSGCKRVFLDWSCKESSEWVRQWYERSGYEEVGFSGDKILLQKYL